MFHLAHFQGKRNFRFCTLGGVQSAVLLLEVVTGTFQNELVELPEKPESRLLEDFINWPTNPQSILRFTKRYGPLEAQARPLGNFSFEHKRFSEIQTYFRGVWSDPTKFGDWEAKDGCLRFHAGTISYTARNLFTYFQCVFSALQADRVRVCRNDGCSHPYFIATHRKQQFCGKDCSDAAQRNSKRAWWERSGQVLRTMQREEARKHAVKKRSKVITSK